MDEFDDVNYNTSPRTTETSFTNNKKVKFSLMNSYRSSKGERKESQAEEIKEENLPDSLTPLVKFASIKASGGNNKQK